MQLVENKHIPHFSSHPLNYLGTAATFILLENVGHAMIQEATTYSRTPREERAIPSIFNIV